MHPFICSICGDGFEQRSHFERHLATAHPPSALTAADVEKALSGIQFPGHRDKIVDFAAGRFPPGSEVMRAIESLPDRVYNDAAEVAVAFGSEPLKEPDRAAESTQAEHTRTRP